jgi:hypothetical protein
MPSACRSSSAQASAKARWTAGVRKLVPEDLRVMPHTVVHELTAPATIAPARKLKDALRGFGPRGIDVGRWPATASLDGTWRT